MTVQLLAGSGEVLVTHDVFKRIGVRVPHLLTTC
jgi:hypothetical protein